MGIAARRACAAHSRRGSQRLHCSSSCCARYGSERIVEFTSRSDPVLGMKPEALRN